MDGEIAPFFTTEELNELARESGFVQRESKLNGSLFLDLIVFNAETLRSQSLNDMSATLKDSHGIEITKQSLHERFNESALVFLKTALERLLQQQLDSARTSLDKARGFDRILIKDSTSFQADASLSEYYPGSGGSGSAASVRIQFEYDILSGKINDLSVNPFNIQDATDSVTTLELTRSGDLIIRDLAYMGLDVLEQITQKLAYYVCRANPIVNIYEKKGNRDDKVDFVKVCRSMRKYGMTFLEKAVYLGNEKKLKTRLIVYRLPEQEVARRLRKAREARKKKGRGELSKEYKVRASLNLFVTNANYELIVTKEVWPLYQLRWQIELIFKTWKSICNIEKVKKVNRYRFECYIYSKLILIVLGWHIIWQTAKQLFRREGKALSFLKASKTLLGKKIAELRELFMLGKGRIEVFMARFYDLSRTNHLLEKRQKEPTSLELLLSALNVELHSVANEQKSAGTA